MFLRKCHICGEFGEHQGTCLGCLDNLSEMYANDEEMIECIKREDRRLTRGEVVGIFMSDDDSFITADRHGLDCGVVESIWMREIYSRWTRGLPDKPRLFSSCSDV